MKEPNSMEITLREIESSDLEKINLWRNNKAIVDLLGNNFRFISLEVDKIWFENYIKNRKSNVRLAILFKGAFVGMVNLTDIHEINQSAEFSIIIGEEKFHSKGIGYFASKEILKHGFNNLNLNRIFLEVVDYNTRAIFLYKKLGFVQEGKKRKAIYKNGTFCDITIMSLLKSEFLQNEQKT